MSHSAVSTAAIARHRHRPAPPVGALVEVLPGVLDAPRVAADEQRHDVIGQVAGDRELAAVQRRVAETVDAVLGHELQRDEVAAGTADDDLGVDDFHRAVVHCGATRVGGRAAAARSAAAPASAIATSSDESGVVAAGAIAQIADQHRRGRFGDAVGGQHDAHHAPEHRDAEQLRRPSAG